MRELGFTSDRWRFGVPVYSMLSWTVCWSQIGEEDNRTLRSTKLFAQLWRNRTISSLSCSVSSSRCFLLILIIGLLHLSPSFNGLYYWSLTSTKMTVFVPSSELLSRRARLQVCFPGSVLVGVVVVFCPIFNLGPSPLPWKFPRIPLPKFCCTFSFGADVPKIHI